MFVTGPPATGTGLALSRVAHRSHGGDSPLAAHPGLRRYVTDLAATRGLPVREDVLGTGQAYAELAEPVIEAVTTPGEPVDLLVFAHGVPDVQPGRNVALHLGSRCPGNPLAFAICDQGPAAAFTALRLIADYAGTGAGCRALLVIAEQPAVPYPLAAPAPVPDRGAAAALLFEAGPSPLEVRIHRSVLPAAAGDLLAAELAELTGTRLDVTLALGSALADAVGAEDVRDAVPGLPYTGLWAHAADIEPGRLLVLADYDPALGYLSLAAVEQTPRPTVMAVAGSSGLGGGVLNMAVKD